MLLIWCLGIFLPILVQSGDRTIANPTFIKKIYSPFCHQDEEKSIKINGSLLPVCSRCTGIYSGSLLISIILLVFRKTPYLKFSSITLLSLPMLIDVLGYSVGLYSYSKTIALITGFIFGSMIFLVIFEAVETSLIKDIKTENVQ